MGTYGVTLTIVNQGNMILCFPQIPLHMKPDPSLKQNSLKDLRVVVHDTLWESLPGIHYKWQIYKKYTAESRVKLKQSICVESA